MRISDWSSDVCSSDLYRVFVPVVEKVIRYTDLPPRDREVLVIRTLAQCNETYEADHHADIAGKCGMSAAEIAAVKEGAGDGLSAFDLQLINAADELLRDKFISAMTWKKLAERYTHIDRKSVV